MCEAPIDIDNSASVSPVVDSPTGTSFTVTCVQGFTPSGGGTGNMECESSGAWSNEPACEGNVSIHCGMPGPPCLEDFTNVNLNFSSHVYRCLRKLKHINYCGSSHWTHDHDF